MRPKVVRVLSVAVLFGIVLPNTLTGGHFAFLLTSELQARSPAHAGHPVEHDHSAHAETPAPAAPSIQTADALVTDGLARTTLWELYAIDPVLGAGIAPRPPAPPPRAA